jgi:hypothetical protein
MEVAAKKITIFIFFVLINAFLLNNCKAETSGFLQQKTTIYKDSQYSESIGEISSNVKFQILEKKQIINSNKEFEFWYKVKNTDLNINGWIESSTVFEFPITALTVFYTNDKFYKTIFSENNVHSKIVTECTGAKKIKIFDISLKIDTIAQASDYWYFIDYEKFRGWLFGKGIVLISPNIQRIIKIFEDITNENNFKYEKQVFTKYGKPEKIENCALKNPYDNESKLGNEIIYFYKDIELKYFLNDASKEMILWEVIFKSNRYYLPYNLHVGMTLSYLKKIIGSEYTHDDGLIRYEYYGSHIENIYFSNSQGILKFKIIDDQITSISILSVLFD